MNLDRIFKFCSDKQKEAATQYIDRHLVIFAAPGSGKTLTLTARIACLLNRGVKPHQIFAATFTKKGADDMKKRLQALLPRHFLLDGMALGTFHHCALSILRANAKAAGVSWNFTIVSSAQQKILFEEALQEFSLKYNVEDIVSSEMKLLSREKIRAVLEEYEEDQDNNPLNSLNFLYSVICSAKADMDLYNNLSAELLILLSLYNKRLRSNKFIDMMDILFLTVNLFTNSPSILETYRKKYRYILVDEFQDTNSMQLQFIVLLARQAFITVCGDDDQAIYGWRGASSHVFSQFLEHFPTAQTVVLCDNYRSTQLIVNTAQSLIRNNKIRKPKDVIAAKGIGQEPEVIIIESCKKEAVIIARLAEFYINKGCLHSEIAVLCRMHSIAKGILEELELKSIPIKSVSKKIYFNNNEIGVVSFLKLIVDSSDEIAFMIIFNWPKRKLGDKAKKRIQYISNYKRLSLYESLKYIVESTKDPPKGFRELYNSICAFSQKSKSYSPSEMVNLIVSDFRLKDCQSLEKAAEPYLVVDSLDVFLQGIDCLEDSDKVTVTTIHQAKGQEWDIVIVPRMNEGYLPANSNVEEERRLAYVAATRAKKHVIFTCVMTGNQGEMLAPSRFIDELFANNYKNRKISEFN